MAPETNPFREAAGPSNPLRGSGVSNPFRQQQQPHVTTKVTYGDPVEDENRVGILTPPAELIKGVAHGLTLNNIETLGYAIEALEKDKDQGRIVGALRGMGVGGPTGAVLGAISPGSIGSMGAHIQKWAREGREKIDDANLPITWEEGKDAGVLGIISYYSSLLGQGIGSTALPLAAGAAGMAVAGPLGAGAGAVGVGALMSLGETYRQLKDEDVPVEKAKRVAIGLAPVLGALEAIGAGKIISSTVGKEIKKKTIAAVAKQVVGFGAGDFTSEAVTEGIQAAVRESTAAVLTGNADYKRRALAVIEETVLGGAVGKTLGMAGRGGKMALGQPGQPATPGDPPSVVPAPTPEAAPVLTPEAVPVTPEAAPVTQPVPPEPNPFRDQPTPAPAPLPTPEDSDPHPVPQRVQRIEEKGVGTSSTDKPHGLYTSPENVDSPHKDLGGKPSTYAVNPDANILKLSEFSGEEVAMRRGTLSAGANVHVARELLGATEFKRLKLLRKKDLAAEAAKIDPDVEWSRYVDAQEIMEGIGGILAKQSGYDAIWVPDTEDSNFSEFVALTDNAFTDELKAIEGPVGKETVLHTPDNERRARYRLSEAGTLQPSHDPVTFGKNVNYPEGVQERLYHSNKDAQAEVIKVSQDFKPARVINSDPTAINGPPQATSSGVVIGGNQRDMATQRMYLDGNGEKYRQYLLEHAEEFGFTKDDVLSLKNPELWREILDAPADVEGMRVLGSDLNKDFKKALSEVEQAVTAGKNLSKESADAIAVEFEKLGETGTLRKAMADKPILFRDALLRDGVLSSTDLPKFFTAEGAVNEAGKTFIEKAMVGSVIQDADLLQSMPKSLVAKVLRIVPQMIETGQRLDKWNITEDVKDGIRQVSAAHIRGIKLEEQLGQISMFGEGPTPAVKALARVMSRKELEISATFKAFANDARTDKPGQAAMFGKADPVESFGRIFGAAPGSKEEVAVALEETLSFAAGRPTLPGRTKPTSLTTKGLPQELVRRSEILENLTKELNGLPKLQSALVLRLGRISKPRALGIYKPKAEVARLRLAGDIPVAMHEVAHHLNKLMYGGTEGKLNTAPLNEYSDELGKIATKGDKKEEGFAEFVRLYLTDPGKAMDAAPRFHAAFEKKMAEMPELQDVLVGTRQKIRRYIEQPDSVKAMSLIRRSSDLPRARWSIRQIYTDIFNKLNPVEKTVEEMERRKGERLPTEKNAGDVAQLASGWSDRAGMFMSDATFDIDGKVNGKALEQITDPLLRSGQRDVLDAYLYARRVRALAPRGIEQALTLKEAEQTIKELETPEIIAAAKEVYGFEDRLQNLRVQGGLMTQEEADANNKANPDYVPLYKYFAEEGKGGNVGGKGFLNLGGGHRIKTSGREILSPLENIVADVESTFRDVDHHAAVVAFVDQASKTEGGGQFAEKVPAKVKGTTVKLSELKQVLKENGVNTEGMDAGAMEAVATIFRPDMRPDPRDNIVVVRRKGERELWQLNPEVYKALNASAPVSSNIFTKVLRGGAATLRTTATGTSLEFPMMNFFRDTFFAGLVSPDGFIPVASSIKGTMLYLSNDETYKEFIRAGGGLSTNVEVALHQMGKSNNPLKKTPVMNAFQAMTFLSRVSEMGTRVGYYNVARKAGKTPKAAALEAKDLLNFSRWGAATEAAARYAPFWNSALQGTDKFRRALIEDPKGVTARGVAMLTVPSILIYAANHGNKDYEEAPPWLKDLFWLIPTFDKKTPFIRIPKPHLPGMLFGSLPERAMDFAKTRDPEAFDGAIKSLLQTLLPGMGGVPVPSLAIPVVEKITNYSFFRGRPIEPQSMENLPAELRSQPWTTELAKETSKMLAAVGVKMSPLIIENTLFGITASTGRTVATALNPFLRDKDAPERPTMHWGDMPVARAFAVRPISGVSTQRLYDRLDKLKGMKAAEDLALKHRWIDAKRMTTAERWEFNMIQSAQRLMADISKKVRKIESSQKLSGEEKREQIDKWSARRSKIAADTMAKIRKLKK